MMFFKSGADVYQLCTWDLKDGKGFDDFVASKAGTDLDKQREVYHGLFENAVPFIETLSDSDIKTVTAELHVHSTTASSSSCSAVGSPSSFEFPKTHSVTSAAAMATLLLPPPSKPSRPLRHPGKRRSTRKKSWTKSAPRFVALFRSKTRSVARSRSGSC